MTNQARNQKGAGGRSPLETYSPPWKNVLDTVQKIWAPLRKFFALPGVPRSLRACDELNIAKLDMEVVFVCLKKELSPHLSVQQLRNVFDP